ncbi:MAG: ATP-binding protein [Chloroflexi bacterium]|nr:ATP-binding protein [Chloroflexota bacterium]
MTESFIDRAKESAVVCNMVRKKSIRALVFLGEGGLGKTRLLQEIPAILDKEGVNITCPEVIDFDNMIFRVTDNLVHVLLEYLPEIPEREKDSLYAELERLYDMERRGDTQKTRAEQDQLVVKRLAEIINNFSQTGYPVLLRFDTIEKMDPDVQDALTFFTAQLDQAFVVFAGRPETEAISFQKKLEASPHLKKKLDTQEILPFSADAQEEYLLKTEEEYRVKLSQQDVDLLLKYSKGRPILIDLAIEYFSREPEATFHTGVTSKTRRGMGLLDKAGESKRTLEQEFEYRLVNFVTTMRSKMQQLILVLSRVYPLSAPEIAHMLNIAEDEANKLFKEAQSYVFIKGIKGHEGVAQITLHDEMRRMVMLHVWPEMDKSFGRRRRDSEFAKNMYAAKSERLRERINELKPQIRKPHSRETYSKYLTLVREREAVTEEQLRHALYADFSTGFTEWQTIVNKIRAGRKYSFASHLCRLVHPYTESTKDDLSDIFPNVQLTEQQLYDYYYIEARSHQDLGQLEEAEKRYLTLLGEAKKSGKKERERQIANMLGVLKRDQGEYKQAVDYQKRCRKLQPPDNYWAIANVENSIGYVYLLQKDQAWEYLDEARDHFEKARDAARKAFPDADPERKTNIKSMIAAIKNNLGYIYGLYQKYDRGEQYCKDAIEIWEEIGRTVEIAWAKTHLGVMARDQRQYQHAAQRLNEAIFLLDPDIHDNFRELCNAHLQLGWTQWFMAAIDSDKESRLAKLEEAQLNLEKSLQFTLDHEYNTELPDAYHQLASVYWELSKQQDDSEKKSQFQKLARETNVKSIEWSRKLNNVRYLVDAWIGEMEFDYDIEDDSRLAEYLDILKPYEKHNFPLYWGRVKRIQGDWAWRKGDLDAAFMYYGEGIPLINSHGGYGPYKIEIELAKLADKLKDLPVEEAEKYLAALKEAWKGSEGRVDLDFWIEEQLDQIHILK